jgi:ankyrin repeat protein
VNNKKWKVEVISDGEIMKIKLWIALVLSLSIFNLTACQRETENAPMTPEMAKSMIKLRGFTADEAGLFKAVRANDTAVLNAFFDTGISPNVMNDKGETLLTFAIQYSEPKTVNALLEKADINQQDKNGNAPLHLALYKNKEDIFDRLLAKNANVNVGGLDSKTKNQTPLYLAVIKSREDLVQKLLERGADPNIADSTGYVALGEACTGIGVNAAIVKLLLDKGANPNYQEPSGATALMYIAGNEKISAETRTEILKMLLAKGADKKLKDKKGRTALDAAKEYKLTDAVEVLK